MVETRHRLLSWRLATAEITYHLPDYPDLLQNYIWQEVDLIPEFPMLRRFLDFWSRSLEGRLHSVKVGAADLVKPAEFRFADGLFVLQ